MPWPCSWRSSARSVHVVVTGRLIWGRRGNVYVGTYAGEERSAGLKEGGMSEQPTDEIGGAHKKGRG